MYSRGNASTFSRQCFRAAFSSAATSSVSASGSRASLFVSSSKSAAFSHFLDSSSHKAKAGCAVIAGTGKAKTSLSFSTTATSVKNTGTTTTAMKSMQLSTTRPLVISGVTQFGPLIVELVNQEEDEEATTRSI